MPEEDECEALELCGEAQLTDVAPDLDHDLWTLLQRLPARARAVLLLFELHPQREVLAAWLAELGVEDAEGRSVPLAAQPLLLVQVSLGCGSSSPRAPAAPAAPGSAGRFAVAHHSR